MQEKTKKNHFSFLEGKFLNKHLKKGFNKHVNSIRNMIHL